MAVSGEWYTIEVQVDGNTLHIARTLYYWAELYSSQLKTGQGYEQFVLVICINLLQFNLFEHIENYHPYFLLTEKKDKEHLLTYHCAIHFIELPKFTQKNNLIDS